MTELLTSAQMRAIEQAAIDSGEVTGLELMERAGRGVVEAIFEGWPDLAATSRRAVVLCGPGNNGGDGFVVARLLKEWGWEVEAFLYGDPEKLPPDARTNYVRWGDIGAIGSLPDQGISIADGTDVMIDAVFGTGLTRPAEGKALGRALRDLCDCIDGGGGQDREARVAQGFPRVVSIDLPSGVCADSGRVLGGGDTHAGSRAFAAAADLTVAFHRLKIGHVLADGPRLCGKVVVKDIGLKGRIASPVRIASLPRTVGKRTGHKYTHGHALILSGGPGRGGAARLAARGALRIGAGLATVGCPPEALVENAARLDAVMLKPVHDADALTRILEDVRINALALGPGLGTGEREAALVAASVACGRPLVLDADALTLLSQHPDLVAALHDRCILTPHAGEFARLFPDIAGKLNAPATKGPAYSKLDATREAAARAGCTVLFKGPDTVIADPSGRCAINSASYERAAPWLATAGSGDVLAGFIAGLLARGFPPMQAAEAAAWLHVECALSFGAGLIAEDLPEELPKVFRALAP